MNENLIQVKNESQFVFGSYKTGYWYRNIINYYFLIGFCIGLMILTIINIGIYPTLSNGLVDVISLVYPISVIAIAIFWISYNRVNYFNATFNNLKMKSKQLDKLLLIYVSILYILIIYMSCLFFGVKIRLILTPLSSAMIWLTCILWIWQSLANLYNKRSINNQSSFNISTDRHVYTTWWPNLVYSYWLDKAFFSFNNFRYNSHKMVILNKNALNSVPTLKNQYDEFLSKFNYRKTLVQQYFSNLVNVLLGFVVMLLASLAYWIGTSHPSSETIAFFIILWIGFLIICSRLNTFVNNSKFQIINKDNETDINNYYDVITINFNSYLNKYGDPLTTNDIPEEVFVLWLGYLRKWLLYWSSNVIKNHSFLVEIYDGYSMKSYNVECRFDIIDNLKYLYFDINFN